MENNQTEANEQQMMDRILTRQQSLNLTIPNQVAVIGCGGVGYWAGLFLAMAGVPRLHLWDFDHVSEHNLNRIPLPEAAVGLTKSSALRDEILRIRPKCRALAMGSFSVKTARLMTPPPNWVVVATDTLKSREMVSKWAQGSLVRYVEVAAEGEYGSITGEPAEFATEQEAQPGYASVPVWVGPCVIAAAMACDYVLHNQPVCHTHRVGFDGKQVEFFSIEE